MEGFLEEQDDDVIPIGKLRRPGIPGVEVSYDPGHGIRVEGEDVPPDPSAAAVWVRTNKGCIRVYSTAKRAGSITVRDFIRACNWRRHPAEAKAHA